MSKQRNSKLKKNSEKSPALNAAMKAAEAQDVRRQRQIKLQGERMDMMKNIITNMAASIQKLEVEAGKPQRAISEIIEVNTPR